MPCRDLAVALCYKGDWWATYTDTYIDFRANDSTYFIDQGVLSKEKIEWMKEKYTDGNIYLFLYRGELGWRNMYGVYADTLYLGEFGTALGPLFYLYTRSDWPEGYE